MTLNGIVLGNWTMEGVPLTTSRDITEIMQLLINKQSDGVPGFFHGTFQLPDGKKPLDTFLDPTGWTRGFAFVNGINLGRYWPKKGPQITLYVPAPFMLPYPEKNRLFLLEMEEAPGRESRTVGLVSKHVLDGPVTYRT